MHDCMRWLSRFAHCRRSRCPQSGRIGATMRDWLIVIGAFIVVGLVEPAADLMAKVITWVIG